MVIKQPFNYSPKNQNRTLHIYLPNDYDASAERYPVMYFFDGHNLFRDSDATYGKCWGLEAFLDGWQKKMIVVGLVVLCARHRAPYIYIVWFEQGGGSFEARRGIVVACNGHYLQAGQAARGFGEKVVKHLLGRSRGIGGVENVTRDEQGVRLLLA